MKLERLTLRGFTHAFPGAVDLALGALDPGLVALVGANGQGKTTLLEATPAAIFRQLPARNGADPVDYATGRDSSIVLEFTARGDQRYRSTLQLDGPKRQTDAVLQQRVDADLLHDWITLTDGKRSTYDDLIRTMFPSFDLFINSAFAAQGRGDEFTRRKPSQRKDLFAEFLTLGHFATMSKSAGAAADLCDDARLRLEARVEALERETADTMIAELDALAQALQTEGGAAELRQPELRGILQTLEARIASLPDGTAAHAAATRRVQDLTAQLTDRREELERSKGLRTKTNLDAKAELASIEQAKHVQLRDIATRIDGNKTIQEKAEAIRAAVKRLPELEQQLAAARETLTAGQTRWTALSRERMAAGTAVQAFVGPQKDLDHAKTGAALLKGVPCSGAGEYAACQLLVSAKQAEGRIVALEAQLTGLQAAIETRDRLDQQLQTVSAENEQTAATITRLEADLGTTKKTAEYEKALIDSDARLAELQTKTVETETAAAKQLDDARHRHTTRLQEFDAADLALGKTIAGLELALKDADDDLRLSSDKHAQLTALQAELTAARAEWDQVTATLASVASRREDLERRRWTLAEKQKSLVDVRDRLARVKQELVEWRSLAKDLGKGGLPDLEIDAAGPSITALTNDLLTSCFGPRFTVELVTQTEKASGGMKDEFTVRVFDNEAGGDWRDISDLSGGEKVVVQEALMCAISLFVNERSPMPIRTLWRDETGAALDPENAVRYVQMLRKVRELGGFWHVFFISHNPAAAALADAQIIVGGGTARIQLPPFGQEAA